MLIDLTMPITSEMLESQKLLKKELEGHLGTHFDVMNEPFPLAYTRRRGVLFDVRKEGEEIDVSDVDLSLVSRDAFVLFYTGYSEKEPYGTRTYYSEHPQLTHALIGDLVARGVSIIGVDCAGVRHGKEHTPTDRYCAERGVFIVENLCGVNALLRAGGEFTVHTYPMYYTSLTGLPCRVIAEVEGTK